MFSLLSKLEWSFQSKNFCFIIFFTMRLSDKMIPTYQCVFVKAVVFREMIIFMINQVIWIFRCKTNLYQYSFPRTCLVFNTNINSCVLHYFSSKIYKAFNLYKFWSNVDIFRRINSNHWSLCSIEFKHFNNVNSLYIC